MKLTTTRRIIIIISSLLLILAWVQIWRSGRGLAVQSVNHSTLIGDGQGGSINVPPYTIIWPENRDNPPVVLVVHGFSASKTIMQGYGNSFAHSGYAVIMLDLAGHGFNSAEFPLGEPDMAQLVNNVSVVEAIWQQATGDTLDQIALLGHSMGTQVVLRAALQNPERYKAVIMVSPTSNKWAREGDIDLSVVPNLMTQAGQFEPIMIRNAENWMTLAGGKSYDFQGAGARSAITIPRVGHISILSSPLSHRFAVNWLAQAFGTVTVNDYVDSRLAWYGLATVAALLVLVMAAPLWRPAVQEGWRDSAEKIHHVPLIGLIVSPLSATFLLFIISKLADIQRIGGLLVGGGFSLWLFIFGCTWLFFVPRPARITAYDLLLGIGLFFGLMLAINLLANQVWLPLKLIKPRLLRWPLLTIAFLPMQLAAGSVQYPGGISRRAGWWLAQSTAIFVGLIITLFVVDGLGFLALILPLFPLAFAIMTLTGATVRYPWPYAIGSALWFAWTLAAVFPLV